MKYPLEKLFHFIAGTIPGAAIMFMIYLLHTQAFEHILYSPFFGYRTKLAVLVCLTLVIGNSLTTFLRAGAGGLGGVLAGSTKSFDNPSFQNAAPWRDRRWRIAAKLYLLDHAPKDTMPISEQSAISFCSFLETSGATQNQMEAELKQLRTQKFENDRDDFEWQSWYRQFHFQVLQPKDNDFTRHITAGFNSNMEATALSVVIGTIYLPSLRCMWVYLFSIVWILTGFASIYAELRKTLSYWSTLDDQVQFLSERVKQEALSN